MSNDELRIEYDLTKLKGGVRGKYYKRATRGTNLVLIDPELSKIFPDAKSVNNALRRLVHKRPASSKKRTRTA
jgi:hypothetical protein